MSLNSTIEFVDGSVLVIDAVTNISPSYKSQLTKHPVEKGVDISDHITNSNLVINLKGIFSDATLTNKNDLTLEGIDTVNTQQLINQGAGGRTVLTGIKAELANKIPDNAISNLFKKVKPIVVNTDARISITGDARAKLLEARTNGEFVSLMNQEEEFEDLVITSLIFPKTKPQVGVLNFTMTLEKVRVVSTKSEKLTKVEVAKAVKEQAAQETSSGTKATTKIDANVTLFEETFGG